MCDFQTLCFCVFLRILFSSIYIIGKNEVIPKFSLDSLELNGTLVADWLAGSSTPSVLDDDFNLSGSAKLTNTNTTNYFDGIISTPLMVSSSCDYTFISGVVAITPSNTDLPYVSLDFIDGDCANLFNATIDCQGSPLSFSYPIK